MPAAVAVEPSVTFAYVAVGSSIVTYTIDASTGVAHTGVTAVGDRPEPALGVGGVLGGNPSQISHPLPRMREAPQIAELGDDSGGGDEDGTPSRLQGPSTAGLP